MIWVYQIYIIIYVPTNIHFQGFYLIPKVPSKSDQERQITTAIYVDKLTFTGGRAALNINFIKQLSSFNNPECFEELTWFTKLWLLI